MKTETGAKEDYLKQMVADDIKKAALEKKIKRLQAQLTEKYNDVLKHGPNEKKINDLKYAIYNLVNCCIGPIGWKAILKDDHGPYKFHRIMCDLSKAGKTGEEIYAERYRIGVKFLRFAPKNKCFDEPLKYRFDLNILLYTECQNLSLLLRDEICARVSRLNDLMVAEMKRLWGDYVG